MLSRIFKPKWQHRDPTVRCSAVEELQDETLLLKIIAEDNNSNVKAAAIAKLQDTATLLSLTRENSTAQSATKQLTDVLCQTSIAPSEEIKTFIATLEQPLLQKIAENAADHQNRHLAVAHIQNQPLLAQLVLKDSHSEVRLGAAEKLSDEQLIRSTIKQLGKRDKRATQTLKQQLDRLGKAQQIEQAVQKLCDSLDMLGRQERWKLDHASLAQLEHEWESLSSQATTEQIEQFRMAQDAASERINQRRSSAATLAPLLETKQSFLEDLNNFFSMLAGKQKITAAEAAEFNASLDNLQKNWSDLELLPETQEAELANQFFGILGDARKQVNTLQSNRAQCGNLETLIEKAEKLLKQKHLKKNRAAKLFNDWETQNFPADQDLAQGYRDQFASIKNNIQTRLQSQDKARDERISQIQSWLTETEATLERDKLGDSRVLCQKIQDLLAQTHDIPKNTYRDIQQRLSDIQPQVRELSGWRQWGTDRAREELIEEAISLQQQEMAVDTRAKAVKALRARWKKLGKIDPMSRQRLWKRFDDACSKAYEPCKQHYNQQAQERKSHLSERQNICADLEKFFSETNWENPDWSDCDRTYQAHRSQWSKAGSVSRKDWTEIQKRYHAICKKIDSALDTERNREIQRRERLIASLEQISADDNLDDGIALAKDIQRQWTPTVSSRRSVEQKLWKRYRKSCDEFFSRRQTNREEIETEQLEQIAQRESLCADFEDKIQDDSLQPADLNAFTNQWQQLPNLKSKQAHDLEKRANKARHQAKVRLQQRATHKLIEYLGALYAHHQALEKLESNSDTVETTLREFMTDQIEAADFDRLPKVFRPRIERNLSGADSVTRSQFVSDRESLLLNIEILLDIESPQELQQQRMERKVQRLSEVMLSGDRQKPEAIAMQYFEDYCATGPVTETALAALESRLQPIFSALSERLES